MSKKIEITLKEGSRLVIDGKQVVVTKIPQLSGYLKFEVLVLGDADGEEQVQGNHQSDKPKGISKQTVLSILQKEVDRLEQEETKILIENPLEDDGLFEHSKDLLADHINNAQAVMVVKKLIGRVQKIE